VFLESNIKCNQFDVLGIGFWVNRGSADNLTQLVIKKLGNCKTPAFLFGTCGADPQGQHIENVKQKLKSIYRQINIIDLNIYQGTISNQIAAKRLNTMEKQNKNAFLINNYKQKVINSRLHPNCNDLKNACKFTDSIINKLKKNI
jgi:hypothetical protein